MSDFATFRVPIITTTARRGNGYGLVTSVPKPTLEATAPIEQPEINLGFPCVGVSGTRYLKGACVSVPAPEVGAVAHTGSMTVFTVPMVQLRVGISHKATMTVPLADITATGEATRVGTASISVFTPAVEAKSGLRCSVKALPIVSVTAHGLVGELGKCLAEIPAPLVTGLSDNPIYGWLDVSTPRPNVAATGTHHLKGTASITVPMIQVAQGAYVGLVGSASITMPSVTVDANGYLNVKGTATITLPLVDVTGVATPSALVILSWDGTQEDVNGYALVMNIETGALSDYSNYGFNSFARFKGQYLGASSSGIRLLSGDTDNGTNIDAKVRTGLTDGKSSLLKGVDDLFMGITTTGIMDAKVVTDGDRSFTGVAITPRENTEVTTQRVKFGKGIKSRYYSVEVTNRNGCDFNLDSAELTLIPMGRKL